MKKTIVGAVVVVILLAGGYGGYVGYERYGQRKFVESITPHVKNASLRLANAVRYETDKDTKITYKELFEKLEADVSEIDKRILDIQTIATPSNKEVTDPILSYLKGSQELLRALLMAYRKQLAVNSASEWSDRSLDELRNSSSYGREYASKAADKAIKEFEKAAREYKEAIAGVRTTSIRMSEVHGTAATVMPSDVLVDRAVFDELTKRSETK